MLAETQRLADKLAELGTLDQDDFDQTDPAFPRENTRNILILTKIAKDGRVTSAKTDHAHEGQKNWNVWGKTTFPRINVAKTKDGNPDIEAAAAKLAAAWENLDDGTENPPAQCQWPLGVFLKRAAKLHDPDGLVAAAIAEATAELEKDNAWKDWLSPKKTQAKARVLLVPDEKPLAILRMAADTLTAKKDAGKGNPETVGEMPKVKLGGIPVPLISVNKTSPYLRHWGEGGKCGAGAGFPALAEARKNAARLQAALDSLTATHGGPNPMTQRCSNGNLLVLASRETALARKHENAEAVPTLFGFILQPRSGSTRIIKAREITLEESQKAYERFRKDSKPPAPLDTPWEDKGPKEKEGQGASQLHYRQISEGIRACEKAWTQKGSKAPEQRAERGKPLPVTEDAVLQDPPPQAALMALHQATLRTNRLLATGRTRIFHNLSTAKKPAKTEAGGKAPPWVKTVFSQNLALQTMCWLNALAVRKKPNETPMKEQPSMLLGAALAAADKAHASWSKTRNNGKIPRTLAGEACLRLAQTDPARAVADLGNRAKPFLAETTRWSQNKKANGNPEANRACQNAFLLREILRKLGEALAAAPFETGAKHAFAVTLGYHSDPWAWHDKKTPADAAKETAEA